jgi:hypothetical protein
MFGIAHAINLGFMRSDEFAEMRLLAQMPTGWSSSPP